MRPGPLGATGETTRRPDSRLARLVVSAAGVVSTLATLVAGAMTWLCLTEPVLVGETVGRGGWAAALRAAVELLLSGLQHAIHFL